MGQERVERIPSGLRARRLPLRSPAVQADAALFATVYQEHHQALFRYICSIVRDPDEAEDVLQSVMLKALVALRSEQRDFELRPWLFRIAHNEAINRIRQRRPTVELDVAHASPVASACEVISDRERLQQLWADLAQLPDRQRQALVLRELSGLSHEEIADVIGTSGRAVKQTIFEARVALSELGDGRAMDCTEIRQTLSDGDGRVRRGRRMRAHLASCTGCRAFDVALTQRPDDLRALAPALPVASATALLGHVLHGGAAVKAGTTAAGGGAGAVSAAGGATATALGGSALGMAVTTKVAIIATTVVAAAGATSIATHHAPPVREVHTGSTASTHPATHSIGTPAMPTTSSGVAGAPKASGTRSPTGMTNSPPVSAMNPDAGPARHASPATAGNASGAPVTVAAHPAPPSTGSTNTAAHGPKDSRVPKHSGRPTTARPAPTSASAHPIKAHLTKVPARASKGPTGSAGAHPTKTPARASKGPARSAGAHPTTKIPVVTAKGPANTHITGATGRSPGAQSSAGGKATTAPETKPSTPPGNSTSVVAPDPPAGPAAGDAEGLGGKGPSARSASGADAAGGAGGGTPPPGH